MQEMLPLLAFWRTGLTSLSAAVGFCSSRLARYDSAVSAFRARVDSLRDSEIHGNAVPYITVSDEQYIANLVAVGLPEVAAQFALGWVDGINSGEWSKQTGDLERLLGRKPTTAAEFFRTSDPTPQA